MKIKKLLSLIMVVLMVAIIPVNAFAYSTGDEYNVYVNGIRITTDNCDDVLGDGGSVRYDDQTDTITLANAKITAGNQSMLTSWYGLHIETSSAHKIELVGNNVIDLRNFKPETDDFIDQICALSANGSLTFCGNGSLKLYTPACYDSTALEYDGTLTFDGCKVEIRSGKGEGGNASGVDYSLVSGKQKKVELKNGADLKVYTGSVEYDGDRVFSHAGIRCDNLMVDKTSKCYVETGDLTAGDVDYVINGAVTAYAVFGGGEVTALAGKVTYTSAWDRDECLSYGIYDIGWPMDEESANGSSLADMTIIARGYDCGTYSTNISLYDMSDKIDILVSENIDGSATDHIKNGKNLCDYPYVMICPEGEVIIEEENEEKSFFEMVIDFFIGLFESFVNFIMSLL